MSTPTTYTNGATPPTYTNGTSPVTPAPVRIDALLAGIVGKSADVLQDWSLQTAPLLAELDHGEIERFKLALVRAGVTKTFIDKSLSKVIASASHKPGRGGADDGGGKQTQAERILELIRPLAQFFTGDDGEHYARVAVAEREKSGNDGEKETIPAHVECHRVKSSKFNAYLSHLFNAETGKVAGSQARNDAKSVMEFWCSDRIEQVFVRVAGVDGKVYLDRGTPDWSVIEIDSDGWRIIAKSPVNFRRLSSMGEMPTPVPCDDISQLALFANVDGHQWPLLVAFIVACMYPRGPYPILILSGEQGSAKSTTLRVIKRLIDPSAAEVRRQPESVRDLMIAASNSWLVAYDNMSHIKDDMADTMCTIATGGGLSNKANYTDGEEYIINIMRPQAINGIGDFTAKPDLIDRAILITPPVIPENQREEEAVFWARFDQAKGEILGALLRCVSIALRNLDSTKLTAKPRMADFARLAVAAEPGYNADHGATPFIDLYMANRDENTASILETSPLARVLWEVIKKDRRWIGTSRLLFTAVDAHATETDRRTKGWPTAENKLRTAIMAIAPALRKVGIVAHNAKTNVGSRWEITYTPKPKTELVSPDDNTPISLF